MDNYKTQHLVALAKEGDESALNQLCSVYGERVRRIIRFRLDRKFRPKLDSVDIVQDALVLALGGLKDFTYRNEGDFLVSAKHTHGQTQWVRIKSLAGEPCRVRPGLHGDIRIKSDRRLKLKQVSPDICEIDMKKGDAVLLY